jgi:hypothetical protein
MSPRNNKLEDLTNECLEEAKSKCKVKTMVFKHFDPLNLKYNICHWEDVPKNAIIRYQNKWKRKASDSYTVEMEDWRGIWSYVKNDKFVLWVEDDDAAKKIELDEEIPMY